VGPRRYRLSRLRRITCRRPTPTRAMGSPTATMKPVAGGNRDSLDKVARYPKPLLYAVLTVVGIANVFNLGADIGAMGDALHLLVPASVSVFVVVFGAVTLIAVLFLPYSTYVKCLKWLTLSLFAYVGVIFFVHVSWGSVSRATLIPHVRFTREYLTSVAAVLGTTISPYLFSGKPRRRWKRSGRTGARRR